MLIRSVWVLLIALLCAVRNEKVSASSDSARCTVQFSESSHGIGVSNITFTNTSYCGYFGVRYASGSRFQDSTPYTPITNGDEDYTRPGPICAQLDDINRPTRVLGEEDCLFLNIYVPERNGTELYPVLVFIHGGGFIIGSSEADIIGADLLLEHQVLVVSLNYRLDVLGFLRYPKFNISGNYGLKDQLVALRWINQYIEVFGGDPKRITLMGQSAGAASVSYHMYSDRSRGLFQQAALLSGSFLAPWAFLYDAERCAEEYFGYLGVSTRDQLVNRDFREFFFLNDTSRWMGKVFASMLFPWFIPSREDSDVRNAFLTKSPHKIIAQKSVLDVPLLIGLTTTEFELFLDYVENYMMDYSNIPNNSNKTMLETIEAVINGTADFAVGFGLAASQAQFFAKLGNLATMRFPVEHFLETILERGQSESVYVYQFGFDGKFGRYKYQVFKERLKNVTTYGPIHGDDLSYIFTPYNIDSVMKQRDEFQDEWRTHRQLAESVANFIKHGNPSTTNLQWTAYNDQSGNGSYLHIDEEFNIVNERLEESFIYELWKQTYNCYFNFGCSSMKANQTWPPTE